MPRLPERLSLAAALLIGFCQAALGLRDALPGHGQGPEMALVQGGCFLMGSAAGERQREADEIQHEVCVDDFYIARYELRFADYDRFAEATGRDQADDYGWGRGDRPAISVSWFDAQAYVEWLSERTGATYRLPTEAQWEYAARGGWQTAYWWGEEASRGYANYGRSRCCGEHSAGRDRWDFTAPVGSFPANAYGLHDTAGNVAEWTCSEYRFDYPGAESRCSDPAKMRLPVVRGGAWYSAPSALRSAARDAFPAHYRHRGVGLRPVRLLGR